MSLVSVILPYRDAASTIDEAIGSVLAATETRLEVIAIDDGSVDDSARRVSDWARRDGRMIAMQSEGRGIVAALRTGMRRAGGPWIARMDADDVMLPDRFRAQRTLLEREPGVGVVGSRVEAFVSQGAAAGRGLERYVAWQNALLTPEDHARDLFIESPLCHPSVMMRRDALEAVGGYADSPWPEDYDLFLRFDRAGWKLAKVAEVLLRWRHHDSRLTFTDPRYASERFRDAKVHYLAPRLRASGRPIIVWGAGPFGRRFARALERDGLRAASFVDIDPRIIGRTRRAAPIVSPEALRAGEATVLVAVGAQGAREKIREDLVSRGFHEGRDFVCVA